MVLVTPCMPGLGGVGGPDDGDGRAGIVAGGSHRLAGLVRVLRHEGPGDIADRLGAPEGGGQRQLVSPAEQASKSVIAVGPRETPRSRPNLLEEWPRLVEVGWNLVSERVQLADAVADYRHSHQASQVRIRR